MSRTFVVLRIIAPLVLAFCLPLANAQQSRGTITGSLSDGQGSAISNAKVEVKNADTGVVTATKTNDAGLYEVDFLIPGTYSISADAPGFKKMVRSALTLDVGGHLQVDLKMELGSVSETITVDAGTPLIETTNASVGRVLEKKELTDLPVGQVNPYNLVIISPGIIFTGLSTGSNIFATGGNSQYRTMGGIGYNEYTLDGMPTTTFSGQPGFTPSSDMVDELKVHTTNFDAMTGFSAGVLLSETTKAGTNRYHGAIYDQMTQTRWNATPFFTRLAWLNGIKNGTLPANQPEQASGRTNTFGTSLGGPVRIPKLYDGRDKFFFYFDFDGIRQNTVGSASSATGLNYNVPQTPWLTGDFSAIQKVNPTLYTIYDPRTASLANGRVTRTPFPNNIIPPSQINNPLVKYYENIYPRANNIPGIVTPEGFNNYFASGQPALVFCNSFLNRYDYNLNSNNRIFVKWYWSRLDGDSADWTYQSAPGLLSSGALRAGTGGDASWVWIPSHDTVLTIGAGITRYRTGSTNSMQTAIKPSDVGLPSYMNAAAGNLQVLPSIQFSTLQSVNVPYPSSTVYTTDTLNVDSVTVKNRHSFKYGWSERRYHDAVPPTGYTSGSFTFNNAYVKQADNTATASNWALEFASFLLGVPSAITYTNPNSPYWSSPMRAFYIQDDWRASRTLNVNLGLRYEYQGGITERYNQGIAGNFDFNATLPYASAVQAAYAANPIPELQASQFKVTGGINYLGQPNKDFTDSRNHFLPRIGAAWQLMPNTVLRLGYGWYDDILNAFVAAIPASQFGYSQNTTTTVSNDNGLNFCCGTGSAANLGASNPMMNPFPNGFVQPYRNSLGTAALSGQGVSNWPRDYNPARQQRWRASLQRQLRRDISIEVAYEGSYAWIPNTYSANLPQSVNYVPQQYYCTGAIRNVTCDNNLTQNVANPFYIGNLGALQQSNPALYGYLATQSTFSSPTIAKARLLTAFPQYTSLSGLRQGQSFSSAEGKDIYRDIMVDFRKRFSNGFMSSVTYTRASGAVQDYYQNPYDSSPSWEANIYAPPNRFVWSSLLELPVGKGKKWLTRGPAEKILGGWQLGWTYQYQTGFWADIYNSGSVRFWNNVFFYGDANDLSTLFKHDEARAANTLQWFDPNIAYKGTGAIPAGFVGFDGRAANQPGTYQVRTFPKTLTALPVDNPRNWDLRIQKTFDIRERAKVIFSADALNVTNHTQFGGPDVNPVDAAFGTVSVQRNVPRFIELTLRIQF